MSFKWRVLSGLGNDELLEIGRGLELDVTTRTAVEYLRDTLARSKPAKLTAPTIEGAFLRIYAHKNGKKPDPKLTLPFRGAAKAD